MPRRTRALRSHSLAAGLFLASARAIAEEEAPSSTPAPEAPASAAVEAAPVPASEPVPAPALSAPSGGAATPIPELWQELLARFALHGWVDASYTFNANQPGSGFNLIPAVGTSGKRHNELTVNHLAVDLAMAPEPVGFRLILAASIGNDFLHSFEPQNGAFPTNVAFHFVQQASVIWNLPVDGLSIEAGILPSHLGAEVMQNKDNWTYTRSWIGDLVPFYNAGLRAGYATGPFVANLYLLNGWGIIGDNNQAKSLGAQLGFTTELATVYVNGWAGPELANDDTDWRVFGDTVVLVSPLPWLSLLGSADLGMQQVADTGEDAVWWGAALAAKLKPLEQLHVTVRADGLHDLQGFVTGRPQVLLAGALVVDVLPAQGLIFRNEARYDWSSETVFELGKAGVKHTEALFSSALIAFF